MPGISKILYRILAQSHARKAGLRKRAGVSTSGTAILTGDSAGNAQISEGQKDLAQSIRVLRRPKNTGAANPPGA